MGGDVGGDGGGGERQEREFNCYYPIKMENGCCEV